MVFYQMLFPASAGVISLCPFTSRVMRMWPIAHELLHSLLTPCMPFLLVTDDVFLSQTVQWGFIHHFFVGLLSPASLRYNWQEWCLSEAMLQFPHTSWNDQHNQAIQHAYRLMWSPLFFFHLLVWRERFIPSWISGTPSGAVCCSLRAVRQTPKLLHSEFVPRSPFPSAASAQGASCITASDVLSELSLQCTSCACRQRSHRAHIWYPNLGSLWVWPVVLLDFMII